MSNTIPPVEPGQSNTIPNEVGITMQSGGSITIGDVVKRDKITHNITNIIHKAFLGGANEERDRRNRRIMLDKVRTFWVKGVLEQSLHGAALIELGMEYKPDAVQYPWNTVLQRPDHSPQALSHGAKMIEVFDQEGGELLILGAPGSGKTTMLLDLARDLITRAEEDEALPIPVVFNLSSWAEKHPPLADWLIEELSFRYDVPKKVGKAWIEKDQVLPLLDGLDEVKLEQRATCVEAINNFRKEHLIHLAVCSRSAEYESLRAQLRLQSAIILQPLTHIQIDTYLESAGEQLASVRALLQRDTALQELAESPLMLSIMVLAYRNLDTSSLPTLDSVEKQREHLFDTYIRRMFERRGIDERYIPRQVTHWLSWLARRMVEHTQTTFYLERMQPDWLPTQRQRRAYVIFTRLIIGMISGLGIGLYGGLFVGLLAGLVGAVVGGVSEIKTVEKVRWSWLDATKIGLIFGLGFGLAHGLVFGPSGGLGGGLVNALVSRLGNGLSVELAVGLGVGLVGGLCFGLVNGLVGGVSEIKTVEKVRWSWLDATKKGLYFGLVGCLVGSLFFGLAFGLLGGLGLGLAGGLKIGDEVETKTIPNQGIQSSVRNAILSGLRGGLLFGLAFWVIGWLGIGLVSDRLVSELFWGLVGGLGVGLVIGLLYGGVACIQHFILRLILYLNGSTSINYVRFLDYCAERIFLRKVGGGYIFVHRLLMEHFASLETDTTPRPGGKQNSVI